MKKLVFILVIVLLIVAGGFILWNNRTVSTITIDINPSIAINLKRNGKVKNIVALNKDAREIVSADLKGTSLEETLKNITEKIIEKDYTNEDSVDILIYTKGKPVNVDVGNELAINFNEKEISAAITVIKDITKADEKLAKKYNISPARAAYINAVIKENENLTPKDLIDKSVRELIETKETGNYCESGYMLEGDFCLKEKERIAAIVGEVCPRGYYDYNGKCYEEVGGEETDKLECTDDFTLEGTNCIRSITIEAEPVKYSCSQGEAKTRSELGLSSPNDGDAKDIVCVDYSNATHPVTPCELPADDPTERMSAGGRCYWHRAPVIAEGCPGKILVGGECWDDASSIYICAGYRDGKQYSSKSEYCEHSIKYLEPLITEYKCPEKYTLEGNKCNTIETEKAHHERICPEGYKKLENGRCINEAKEALKKDGFICDMENSRVKGNECIIYEIIEAKHN